MPYIKVNRQGSEPVDLCYNADLLSFARQGIPVTEKVAVAVN